MTTSFDSRRKRRHVYDGGRSSVRLQWGRQLDDEPAVLLLGEPFDDVPEDEPELDPDPEDAGAAGVELVDELLLEPESLEPVLLSADFFSLDEDSPELEVVAAPPSPLAEVEPELLDDPFRLSVL